jgi:cholest-4-en-3-one 26-monooxygenase
MVTVAGRINVLDPDFYVDPWESYEWLRDAAPVYWDPAQKLWAISRYDDVLEVERDTTRYSSHQGSRPHLDQSADRSMINMDDPAHQVQRSLVSRRFTPRAVRSHEDRVRRAVTTILDEVEPLGSCEAIEAIASRLPAMVICDILGYPADLWPKVRWWSERTMYLAGQTAPEGPVSDDRLPAIIEAVGQPIDDVIFDFAGTTLPIIAARRSDPRADLISVWVQTDGWDDGHVLEEVILVLDGGAETTRTVIGSMIHDLALDLAQRRLLVERPELLQTTAVDEFIRWVSPVLNMRRTATEDHELRGQHIRRGDQLLLMYGSANRDPRAFADPERLDVSREHNRHVAFGFGTHFCLGASLARLEIRVMFEELLRRIPDWELVEADASKILPASFARSYDRVPVRY